jgi:hypothetical protein
MPLPIGYVAEHDLSTPVVICDHCHERITTARAGNAAWRMPIRGPVAAELYFTHKHCHEPFEQAHPVPAYWLDEEKREVNRDAWSWYTWELAWLPVYLGNSLDVNWQATDALVRRLA